MTTALGRCRRCAGPLNTGRIYCSRRCALLAKQTATTKPKTEARPKSKQTRAGVIGRRWEAQRAKVKAQAISLGLPCWICHHPIDWHAPPRTRWSFSVDHYQPRSKGGDHYDLTNLRPAHYGCNSRRGNRAQPPNRAVTALEATRSERW